MLLAPDYHSISAPYGLQNTSSQHLFEALNAAIADMQREGDDETIFARNSRTNIVRAYSCRQDSQLPVVNRNETTGSLREILFNTKTINIGSLGPSDWGVHDGNYSANASIGVYPQMLDMIVEKLGKLKGPDGVAYGDGLKFNRTFYPKDYLLFQALLNGEVHATDVFILIDATYRGTNESCTNSSQCRASETCDKNFCTYPPRPRSLHFRTTCTVAGRDSKFVTKKDSHLFRGNGTKVSLALVSDRWHWSVFLSADQSAFEHYFDNSSPPTSTTIALDRFSAALCRSFRHDLFDLTRSGSSKEELSHRTHVTGWFR